MLAEHGCKIAPATYYAFRKHQLAPSPRSVRDKELKEQIKQVYEANCRVYGARKTWRQFNRQVQKAARCTIERLMRHVGITGARRTVLGTGPAHRGGRVLATHVRRSGDRGLPSTGAVCSPGVPLASHSPRSRSFSRSA